MATQHEIDEVRKVIHRHARWRDINTYLNNIGVAMNIDQPRPRCHGTPCRNAFDPREGAHWCDLMADAVLSIRADLAGVNFNPGDREILRTGLLEEGRAWKARAHAWRTMASSEVKDFSALLNPVNIHVNASIDAYAHVSEYLR
jgi:hypothetical protein